MPTNSQQLSTLVNNTNDQQTVEENVYKLREYLLKDYQQRGYNSELNVEIKKGRKYWKVITDNSVHCFVDVNNGNVYKPASWNKPAAIVRYNLIDNPQIVFERCSWAGGYLYIR